MDISMCQNEECPLKETCLRFKGQPSLLQSIGIILLLPTPTWNQKCMTQIRLQTLITMRLTGMLKLAWTPVLDHHSMTVLGQMTEVILTSLCSLLELSPILAAAFTPPLQTSMFGYLLLATVRKSARGKQQKKPPPTTQSALPEISSQFLLLLCSGFIASIPTRCAPLDDSWPRQKLDALYHSELT